MKPNQVTSILFFVGQAVLLGRRVFLRSWYGLFCAPGPDSSATISAGTSSSRSPAAAAALFLSCCCCTGRGLDTRLGLLLAARTEFICRLVWVAGGEGGSLRHPAPRREEGGSRGRPPRFAAAGSREGKEGAPGAGPAAAAPRLARRQRSRWVSRALPAGDVGSAPPSRPPRKSLS